MRSQSGPLPDQPGMASSESSQPGCTPVVGNVEHEADLTSLCLAQRYAIHIIRR